MHITSSSFAKNLLTLSLLGSALALSIATSPPPTPALRAHHEGDRITLEDEGDGELARAERALEVRLDERAYDVQEELYTHVSISACLRLPGQEDCGPLVDDETAPMQVRMVVRREGQRRPLFERDLRLNGGRVYEGADVLSAGETETAIEVSFTRIDPELEGPVEILWSADATTSFWELDYEDSERIEDLTLELSPTKPFPDEDEGRRDEGSLF